MPKSLGVVLETTEKPNNITETIMVFFIYCKYFLIFEIKTDSNRKHENE